MLRADENGFYPLSTAEYGDLRHLFGTISALGHCTAIEERLKLVKNGKRDVKCMLAMADRLLCGLLATIPPKKLLAIKAELDRTIIEVKTLGAARQVFDDLMIVPMESLTNIINAVVSRECYLCSKDYAHGKRCEIFKAISDCVPYALEKPENGGCTLAGSAILGDIDKD